MNKIWSLTKLLLKSNYADVLGKRNKLWLYALAWLGFTAIGFTLFGSLTFGLYQGLQPLGQQSVIVGLGLAVASVWVFLVSITSILTVFYYEDDVERLLSLPLQPSQIVTAKFITVLLAQYVFSSFFLVPVFVAYGLASSAGVLYYVYSLCIFLCFPIIPLVILSLFMMVLMRFTNIAKNKDRSRLIVGAFSVLFIIGINVLSQLNSSGRVGEEAVDWLQSEQGAMLIAATKYVPTAYIAALSLEQSAQWTGLLYTGLFLLLCMLFYGIFFLAAQRWYLRGVIGLSSSQAHKQRLSAKVFARQVVQSSKWQAQVKKELRLLFRTPVFFLNCVVQSFTMPIVFSVAFFAQGDTAWLREYVQNPDHTGLVLGLAFCAGLFLISSNLTAATAFSRDGASWVLNRYLPVPAATIFFAKTFAAWCVSAAVIFVFAAVLIVAAGFPVVLIVLWLLLCCNGLWFNSLLGVSWDARSADVHWETEQKMFKGRYTSLWSFLVNALIAAATIGLVLLLHFMLHVGMWGMFFMLFTLYSLAGAFVHRSIALSAERIVGRIH